jgi:hypothetical protein
MSISDQRTQVRSRAHIVDDQQSPRYACVNETELIYAPDGYLSIQDSLAACLNNVHDPQLFPNFYLKTPLNISVQIALVDLISVTEITSSVTMSCFFRLYWQDVRLTMPALWDQIYSYTGSNALAMNGIEIVQLQGVKNQAYSIWLPDIAFPDITSNSISSQLLRIYPNGQIYWSRHMTFTLALSTLSYKDFPFDTQTIQIMMYPFSYTSVDPCQVFLNFKGNAPIVLNGDASISTFTENPNWKYNGNYASLYPFFNVGTAQVPRYRSVVEANILIARYPDAIIVRFALPILFIAFLNTLCFWIDTNLRMGLTLSLMATMITFYIVIYFQIPNVGYVSLFVTYAFSLFVVFVISTICHIFAFKIRSKMNNDLHRDKHPSRKILCRLFDAICRITVFPVVLYIYHSTIGSQNSILSNAAYILIEVAFPLAVFIYETNTMIIEVYKFMMKMDSKLADYAISLKQNEAINVDTDNNEGNRLSKRFSFGRRFSQMSIRVDGSFVEIAKFDMFLFNLIRHMKISFSYLDDRNSPKVVGKKIVGDIELSAVSSPFEKATGAENFIFSERMGLDSATLSVCQNYNSDNA